MRPYLDSSSHWCHLESLQGAERQQCHCNAKGQMYAILHHPQGWLKPLQQSPQDQNPANPVHSTSVTGQEEKCCAVLTNTSMHSNAWSSADHCDAVSQTNHMAQPRLLPLSAAVAGAGLPLRLNLVGLMGLSVRNHSSPCCTTAGGASCAPWCSW